MDQLHDLPALARFCEEMKLKPRKLPPHSVRMLVDVVFSTDSEEYPLRSQLNECFALAYATKGMTDDRKARLAHRKDFRNYKSATGELKIARWLSSFGATIIQWDPPAGDRRGELLVSLGEHEVFVEVKTFFGDSNYAGKGKTADLIAQDIASLRSKIGPFAYHVLVVENRRPYATGSIRPTILDMVRRLENGLSEIEQEFCEEGLRVEVTLQRDYGNAPVWSTGHVGWIDQHTPLRESLERAQRSASGIPSIVCIYDFDWQLQHKDRVLPDGPSMVLFGTHVSNQTGRGPSEYRRPDGLWKEGQTSSLHAVFLYSEKFSRIDDSEELSFIRIVSGYLNPITDNPLTKDVFGPGVTRWIDSDLPYYYQG